MDANDTETLLALVASLITGKVPDTNALLDALVRCDGQVTAAAHLLNSEGERSGSKYGQKRKRENLDDWLKPASKKITRTNLQEKTKSELHFALSTSSRAASPKPVVDLMAVLQQPRSPQKRVPRLSPLMLSNPSLVADNTPCTLHLSVLPPELACKLFYTMMHESRNWTRNKWWLFDRLVESPHRTAFFARKNDGIDNDETWQEAAQYWYNGRMTEPPSKFPLAMEEACSIIERVVNEELKKRKRFPPEWAGTSGRETIWRANVAASNCYRGTKEGVGFHSDQLTYLGPYPTIASLSLGTRRVFSLREVVPTDQANLRKAQTFNIPLPHNSLTIMHASCQERFKHSVPPQPAIDLYRPAFPETPESAIEPSNCRINITFRFYRPDFRPPSIPRCKCGVPTILRPDMKNRSDGETDRYWWACYAGAQNEGKGCNYWKVMNMKAEGRGPCIGFIG